jgi:DGQHR domain-containing protein
LKAVEDQDRDFENKVWTMIFQLRPAHITIGRDPEIKLRSHSFRPDLVAVFADRNVAFVVECKHTKADAFISDWLSSVRHARQELEQTMQAAGCKQLMYLLAVEDKGALKDHTKSNADQLRVRLVDEREVDYFLRLRKSGIGINHLFLASVAPQLVRQKEERLPALHIKRGKGRDAFVFSTNAHDLLSRSFVSHRELHSPEEGEVGFQRMLQRKKLREIARYIEKYRVFPTPIVVAFRKRPVFEPLPLSQRASESTRGDVEFGRIKLPGDPRSIQVIDGQHRLYGYSLLPENEQHIVSVIALEASGDQSPASTFVDINSKQTRVSGGLLWELYPDIYGDDDPEYYKATISRVTEAIARKRLAGHVEIITTGMKGEMSFHALCAEIKRTRLYQPNSCPLRTERELSDVLDAFFTVLNELGVTYPSVNPSFVYSNNGIAPMIRTMGRIVNYEIAQNRRPNVKSKPLLVETLKRFFEPVYHRYANMGENALRNLRKESVGNAGSNRREDQITGWIRSDCRPDFPYREKTAPPDWTAAIDEFVSRINSINGRVSETGKVKSWVFSEFDGEKIKSHLARKIDDSDRLGTVLRVLYQEIIEGSGKDGPENRLAPLLGVQHIYEVGPIERLNTLRTYWEHKHGQVDPAKRRKAMEALQHLLRKSEPVAPSDLTLTDYQNIATNLLRELNSQVLEPALEQAM